MNHVTLGLVVGLVAGAIAAAAMLPLSFADKRAAIAAAFVSRFAIGFLTVNTALPIHPLLTGAGIGLLISIPDALITKAYAPILGMGVVLGALSGAALLLLG